MLSRFDPLRIALSEAITESFANLPVFFSDPLN